MFTKNFNKININHELNEAIINSNLEKVKSLFLMENQPFVDHEINGVPLILFAAQHKDWEIVEVLYNQGANLDVKVMPFNWYLIHECIKNAPDKVTNAVLEYCNINAQTKDGKTPLMVAIKEKKIGMANYLVDGGKTDLSLIDKKQNNAAHYAAELGEYELFIKLIQSGTPINKENYDGQTPIDLIKDMAFKENLPKILGEIAKSEKVKMIEPTINTEILVEKKEEKKLSGLSSIKRKN